VADDELRDLVLERLEPLEVEVRPLFGSHGLYLGGRYFGFVAGGRLYFRTDEASRGDHVARGMTAYQPPNRPRGPHTVDRNFEVPAEVLEDPGLLQEWAERAAHARR
jgi:TfoX/Sxy family transcriptional regulator of competence genes